MRVALLTPVFWPEVRRGTERLTRELADGLRGLGHAPRIVTSHRSLLPERAVEDGVEVVRVPRALGSRLRRRLYEDHLPQIPGAYAALRAGGDDVAHAMHPASAAAALHWGARTGRPVVFAHMGIAHRQALANRRLRMELMVRASRDADAVVALSRAAADGFRRWLHVDARVIAPPVDLDAFAPAPDPQAARAEHPTVLCAADAGEPRKRVGLLAEAFAAVRREHPRARLVLQRPRDAALAGRLGAEPGVELRDLDDRAVLAAANREAWVAALPSVGEAFGLVAAEALACGTPVVVSDREALPELVDDDALGRRFAGDDPATLARALLEALELNRDDATAARCRARVKPFSAARCAAAYEALYEEVGGARRG